MSRGHEYYDSNYYGPDSRSSIDEYIDHIARLQRMPSMITDFPDIPVDGHRSPHGNSVHVEKHDDHQRNFHVTHHQHHAPEEHKRLHFSEHQKITEIDRDGKREIYEEKTIDVEADGYINQKHKNFELSKWDTFRPS